MKRSNIGTIALVAVIGAGYLSSALNKETNDTALPANPSSSVCDPNYSGCVPVASDVDCAGGGGNGPEYVKGPIRVIGQDIYHLDGDGDGIACE
jgi:resuscitation-promoting factor RpfB